MAVKKQDANNGKITLDRKILVWIINLGAKEINGVESVTNSARPWYKKIFNEVEYVYYLAKSNCGKLSI